MHGTIAGPSAQVDLTAINAVQSLFTKGVSDPWASNLAADFIDLALWHDRIRYPLAFLAGAATDSDTAVVPPLLADLQRRDADWFVPEPLVLEERRRLAPDLLEAAVAEIGAFAINNLKPVRRFLDLHESRWIGEQIRSRSRPGSDNQFVFDLEALYASTRAKEVAARLNIPRERFHYLFDLILKYLLYAEQGTGGYYLTHPIRAKQSFRFLGSSLITTPGPSQPIPISLGPHLARLGQQRGRDWLTSALHETRAHIRAEDMTLLNGPDTLSRDALWELTRRLRLPAKLRSYDRLKVGTAVTTASAGLLSLELMGAPLPAAVGMTMSLATNIWSGKVPNQVSRIRWIQWMFESPLEND